MVFDTDFLKLKTFAMCWYIGPALGPEPLIEVRCTSQFK